MSPADHFDVLNLLNELGIRLTDQAKEGWELFSARHSATIVLQAIDERISDPNFSPRRGIRQVHLIPYIKALTERAEEREKRATAAKEEGPGPTSKKAKQHMGEWKALCGKAADLSYETRDELLGKFYAKWWSYYQRLGVFKTLDPQTRDWALALVRKHGDAKPEGSHA